MLFDTNTKHHHQSLTIKHQRIRLVSNASTYDNIILPITNGDLS
jgi:hypothetical protein